MSLGNDLKTLMSITPKFGSKLEKLTEVPSDPGVYWYYNAEKKKYEISEVVEDKEGNKAKFMNGRFQRWCGDECFFIGPLKNPGLPE